MLSNPTQPMVYSWFIPQVVMPLNKNIWEEKYTTNLCNQQTIDWVSELKIVQPTIDLGSVKFQKSVELPQISDLLPPFHQPTHCTG